MHVPKYLPDKVFPFTLYGGNDVGGKERFDP